MDDNRLTFLSWRRIAKKCPLQCRIYDPEKKDDEFLEGELSVEELNNGYNFFHKGLNLSKKFIYLYCVDTCPDNDEIEILIQS